MKKPDGNINNSGLIRKRKTMSFDTRRAMWGRLYILPWFIGVVFFFVIPFVQAAIYTFNKITISKNGFELSFIKFENYIYAFTKDSEFLQKLTYSIGSMLYQVPIIVFFSLFVAMVLKSEFRGRTLARSIFFFPVIIASGVVITVLKENVMMGANISEKQSAYLFQAPSFAETLANIGLSPVYLNLLTQIISQLFDLTWKSGVQILLLLAAVNNIPKSSYEVADIEGATEWEKFWKITFPLVSPTILVAVIYTIIDSFTDYGNQVMRMIADTVSTGRYEYGTTIAFVYFICVLSFIGIINWLLSKRVFYVSD